MGANYLFYVKMTNNCNLKCLHCYNEQEQNSDYMSDEIVDKTIKYIGEFAASHKDDNVSVKFHGGEPLIADHDKIKKIIDKLSVYKNITFSATTNLVYKLKDSTFEIFDHFAVLDDKRFVQTSWDYKIRFANSKQLQLWEDNVRELVKRGYIVQCTVTLTKPLIENYNFKQIADYLIGLGITHINLERLTVTGRACDNLQLKSTNKSVNDWLLDGFKHYLTDKRIISVGLFDNILASLDNVFLDCRTRSCAFDVTTINPNGKLTTCPNASNLQIGDFSNNKTAIFYSRDAVYKHFDQTAKCLTCEYYSNCRGDCMQLKWDDSGCPGCYPIYQYCNDNAEKIAEFKKQKIEQFKRDGAKFVN